MIDQVAKALATYLGLDTLGKRLFRDELGLVRPQQARPRRRRTVAKAGGVPVATALVSSKSERKRRTATALSAPTSEQTAG